MNTIEGKVPGPEHLPTLSENDKVLLKAIDIRLGRLGSMQMFADNFLNIPAQRERCIEVVAENLEYYQNKRDALTVAIPEMYRSETPEVVALANIESEFIRVFTKAVDQLEELLNVMEIFINTEEGTDEYMEAMDTVEQAGFDLLAICQNELIVFQGQVDKQPAYVAYRNGVNERDRESKADLDELDLIAAK